MNKIHVIGCGGIGSYLIRELYKLQKTNQLINDNGEIYTLHIHDQDEVEQKNIIYQDYTIDDIFTNKAAVLGKRYSIEYGETFVNDLSTVVKSKNDIVICCVDNAKFREHLFNWQTTKPNFWIDLRSHGRIVVRIVRHPENTLDVLLGTLPKTEEAGGGSCQRAADLEKGIIQMGNRIIAQIGCQSLLNYLRRIQETPNFTRQF